MEATLIKIISEAVNNPQVPAGGVAMLVILVILFYQFKRMQRQDGAQDTVDTSYQGIVTMLERQHKQCEDDRRRDREECDAQIQRMVKRIESLEQAR